MSWLYYEKKQIKKGIEETNPDAVICILINKQIKTDDKAVINLQNFNLFELIVTWFKLYHVNKGDEKYKSKEKQTDEEISSYNYILYYFQLLQNANKKKIEQSKTLVINFLFSFISQNIFGVNKYYCKIVYDNKIKIQRSLRNTVKFIFNQSMYDNLNISNFYVNEIIKISKFNVNLKKILENFQTFINESYETKKGITLLSISKSLFLQKKEYTEQSKEMESDHQKAIMKTDSKNSNNKNAQALKMIPYVYKYNSLLSRFILESLTNEEFENLSKVNMDAYEDFLQFHFYNDNLMILSTILSEEDVSYFEVVEVTGKIKKKEISNFTELLPAFLLKEGKEKLINCLRHPKEKNSCYTYEFISNITGYFENFLFNFEISKSLLKNKLILFGFYSRPNTKTMILNFKNGQLGIRGFSKEMSKILKIKAKIFEMGLKKKNFFFLNNLFSNIEVVYDNTKGDKCFDIVVSIKCELTYDSYFDSLISFYEGRVKKDLEKSNEELNKAIEKMKRDKKGLEGRKMKITLDKLFTINENHCLFKCTCESVSRGKLLPKKELNKLIENTFSSSNSSKGMNATPAGTSLDLGKKFNGLVSTSSVTENSISEKTNSTRSGIKNKQSSSFKMQIIKKEMQKIYFVTFTVFSLNVILIGLCFVFLFVQTNQVSLLSKANKLSFDFKSLRHHFYTVFYSLVSITCMEKNPLIKPDRPCSNHLVEYMDQYEKKIGFKDYHIIDYLWFNLGVKINTLKEYYSDFKVKLSTKEFSSFQFLLDSEVAFYFIEQQPDKLMQVTDTITFDVAMEVTINTHFILINEATDEKEYIAIPYYVINGLNRVFELEVLYNQNWNSYQQGIFKVVGNLLNFAKTFNTGDKTIEDFFNKKKKENLLFSCSFMVLFIVLNSFILLMNLEITKFWHDLFKKIILHIITRISKPEFKEFLNKKLESLIQLSEMYKENPNSVMQNLEIEKVGFRKKLQLQKEKQSVRNSSTIKAEIQENIEEAKLISLFIKDDSFQMKEFTNHIIRPLYINNIFLFGFYLVLIVILDVILLIIIFEVYAFRKYISMVYDFETYLYADIALIHFSRIVNTTDDNISDALEKESLSDGIINGYLRDSLITSGNVNNYAILPKYPSEDVFFSLACDKIYDDVKDESFRNFVTEYNISGDPYKLSKVICKDLQMDKYLNFAYEDFISILHTLHNKYLDKTYDGLHAILEDEYFHKIYMYLFFYINPVKQAFDKNALLPTITHRFSLYTTFVWSYLILNILLESFVFSINKLFISKKAKIIEKYLSTFSQCL